MISLSTFDFFLGIFLGIEGPSKAPDKLPKGSYYNKIGKFEHGVTEFNKDGDIIKVPLDVERDTKHCINLFLKFRREKDPVKRLRDDQACLLAWTTYVVGLELPDFLEKLFCYSQQTHRLAGWVTTATGYLRIYCTKSQWMTGTGHRSKTLKEMCQFIVSVYAPGYLRVFSNPGSPMDPKQSFI